MTSDPQFPPLETQRCQTLAGHTMLDDIGFHHHCMVDPFSLSHCWRQHQLIYLCDICGHGTCNLEESSHASVAVRGA